MGEGNREINGVCVNGGESKRLCRVCCEAREWRREDETGSPLGLGRRAGQDDFLRRIFQ
ncbi:hypothetical protein COLO4_32080 [Corchorus olitorius]|uniref:Uncharacterized protein n=1 Tax=Corchorus olitorius TaxID=93759 RepID=A0A1R3H246_9ROSI|nr:hypothetical protein COLO4_32080 [Corchorus olitorius]